MEKSSVTGIFVTDDVALISCECKECDPYFVYKILNLISPLNIKSGMVTTSFIPSKECKVTFAINQNMLISALKALNEIKDIFLTVNGMNTKISIVGNGLSDTEFIVKNILDPLYDCDADIKLITTSPSEISLVLSQSKTDMFLKCLNHLIN